jgi:hypothetical protein
MEEGFSVEVREGPTLMWAFRGFDNEPACSGSCCRHASDRHGDFLYAVLISRVDCLVGQKLAHHV